MKDEESGPRNDGPDKLPEFQGNRTKNEEGVTSLLATPGKKDHLRELPTCLKNEIIHLLHCRDLSSLTNTCKLWHHLATPRLYFLDSRARSSSAIKWCALTRKPYVGVREAVLSLSIRFYGDVNAVHRHGGVRATALHFSAALGNKDITRRLLENKANVSSLSSAGFGLRRWIGDARDQVEPDSRNTAFAYCIRNWSALPLLCPFLEGDMDMIRLLQKYGATAEILKFSLYAALSDAHAKFTVFHYMAADPSYRYRHWAFFLKIFRPWINCQVPATLLSALHVAIRHLNVQAVSALLATGAALESRCVLGTTPLLQAVCSYREAHSKETREAGLNIVESLVHKGANVNVLSGPEMDITPLIASITFLGDDLQAPQAWGPGSISKAQKLDLIHFFVRHNADPNARSNSGFTAVHLLCLMIIRRNGDRRLQGVLQTLLDSGGDAKAVMPYSEHSLIYRIVIANSIQPRTLLSELVSRGSRVKDEEVDAIFRAWVGDFRSKAPEWYDVAQHRTLISPLSITAAFNVALQRENLHLFNYLRENINVPANAESFIKRALLAHKHKLWPAILDLPFNTGHVDRRGFNFIHLVVHKFTNYEDYKESAAIMDVQRFLDKGVSAAHRDANGVMPVKKLVDETPSRDLENLLFRHTMKELGCL